MRCACSILGFKRRIQSPAVYVMWAAEPTKEREFWMASLCGWFALILLSFRLLQLSAEDLRAHL